MRKFLPLLLCLSLSIFTVARATKLAVATRQQADANTFFTHANSEEESGSDNDENAEGTSNDDENTADDNADNAAGDQDTGNDDGTNDNGADDDAGDDGDGGGGE
jgi:hypothetical protein